MGQWLAPQIDEAYATGKMPPMLPVGRSSGRGTLIANQGKRDGADSQDQVSGYCGTSFLVRQKKSIPCCSIYSVTAFMMPSTISIQRDMNSPDI